MKQILLVVSLTLGVATSACAQRTTAPAKPASSASEAATSKLSPVYTDGKCHFRFKVVSGQGYDQDVYMYMFNPTKENFAGWGFGFGCHAGASQNEINGLLDAEEDNGKWIWRGTGKPFSKAQHFKAYKFSGTNWQGIAVAYDMTTGPEDTRQRLFGYCLIERNGDQVLCGGTPVNTVGVPDSYSTLPKIMAVLKTIVFVNPPASAPASASTAGEP